MSDMTRFRDAAIAWAASGDATDAAADLARSLAESVATVLLVEGRSDAAAIDVLATRSGRDFEAERISVVPIGGATAIRRFLEPFGPSGLDLRLAGLVDAGEWRFFRQAIQHDKHPELTPDELEQLGFFICDPDIEHELVRAIGTARTLEVIASESHAKAWDMFRNQPAQRERPLDQQLFRFMATMSGRKSKYAAALAAAVDLDRIPRPIEALLDFV